MSCVSAACILPVRWCDRSDVAAHSVTAAPASGGFPLPPSTPFPVVESSDGNCSDAGVQSPVCFLLVPRRRDAADATLRIRVCKLVQQGKRKAKEEGG